MKYYLFKKLVVTKHWVTANENKVVTFLTVLSILLIADIILLAIGFIL